MACQVHRTHDPRALGTVIHHVWPKAMAGPDIPSNRIEICDTGHRNVHRLLDDLIASDGVSMRRGGTHNERALARVGFNAWAKAGKPGHPVYELHPEESE